MNRELHDRAIGLSDANNFFVSCERRADPTLNNRPVAVLSGNDGCIVARSNEVKALGVPMGAPFFKFRNLLAYHGVSIRSGNHKLYQEISSQVMSLIGRYTDTQEIYSIDECFFNLALHCVPDVLKYCRLIREEVWRKCKIPVSIGIAPTKTLAKLGSEYAKKYAETGGVYWLDAQKYKDAKFMSQFAVSDVWGIGRRIANALNLIGVKNAAQFVRMDDRQLQRKFGVSGVYTAWELRGIQAYPLEACGKAPKSIMVSRSFGEDVTDYIDLQDALLCFTVAAARQLRAARQSARKITVFAETSRFQSDYCANSRDYICGAPLSADGELIKIASQLLQKIFIQGRRYKKCGIILSDFQDISQGIQTSLFGEEDNAKKRRFSEAVDAINSRCKKPVVKPAIIHTPEGTRKKWQGKSEFKSSSAATNAAEAQKENLRFQSHAEDFL